MRLRLWNLLVMSIGFVPVYFGQGWSEHKITVKKANDVSTIMHAETIFADRWDVLPQVQFWKKIMLLTPDTVVLNVGGTRQILTEMTTTEWNAKSDAQKDSFKLQLLHDFSLLPETNIVATFGKNNFYRFTDVYPSLSKGVAAFEKHGVDPWYAQAILLIESPGQLKKSVAGAYGPFQLMPDVARSMGLIVNANTDERKDFEKSALGAARLLSRICVPEARRLLTRYNISFDEKDLWFRLFVMHIYHAGSGNVAAVMNKLQPTYGGQQLITEMWQTKAGHFGTGSQNYSQLAIAAQLILNDMVYTQCDEILSCAK